MTNLSTRLQFQSFAVNADELPQQSIDALLQLGFSTKIKNAIAGVRAGVLGTGTTPWSHDAIHDAAIDAGLSTWGPNEETAQAICDHFQREMFEAIRTGISKSSRATKQRQSPDEAMREAIGIEELVKWSKETNRALPKRSTPEGKKAFFELLAKALTKPKFAARVEQEFSRRNAIKSLDIDDLID